MPLGYFTKKNGAGANIVHPIGGSRRARQVGLPQSPYRRRQVEVQVEPVPEEPALGEEDFQQAELTPEEEQQPVEEEAAVEQVPEEGAAGVQEQEVGPVTPEEHARFLTKRQGYS